jgi:hypothetical protein
MCRKIAIAILLAASTAANAETLIECSKIADAEERVACYDRLAGRVEEKMVEPQVGTTEERIEARQQSVAEEVIGDASQAPDIVTVKISRVIRDKTRRVTYLSEDGRLFARSTSETKNFKEGDTVRIETGMLSAIFLVRDDGMKIKVKEVYLDQYR